MFHRIADGARRVLFLAQREARGLGSEMMGSEHILLGLIAEGEGVAAKALDSFHISLAAARAKVDEVTAAHGAQKTDLSRLPQGTDVPLTAGAKRLSSALDLKPSSVATTISIPSTYCLPFWPTTTTLPLVCLSNLAST